MRLSVRTFFVIAATLIVVAGVTGRLRPVFVADTPSYVDYPIDSLDAALRNIRTPGYPVLLRISGALGGNTIVPWVQTLLHAVAAWALWRELRCWSVEFFPSLAAALALGLGCTFMDNVAVIATDAPAASIGALAAIAMMRWHRRGQRWSDAIFVALFSIVAISLRPAYLALAPWTLVCGMMLRFAPSRPSTSNPWSSNSWSSSAWSWIAMPGLVTAAVLAWMTLRLIVVGDFGVLPFGHQNLAGITVQLVSDDELRSLDRYDDRYDDSQNDRPSDRQNQSQNDGLATLIIAQRDRYLADGNRFFDGDPGATMTMENRWNDMIYQVVVPAAKEIHGDDAIANHDAIKQLNQQIVRRYPFRYVRWLLLAARRAAWAIAADIVMHPIFLTGLGLAITRETWLLWRGLAVESTTAILRPMAQSTERGTSMLFLVGGAYAIIQVGFIIMTSPPLGRFADAAAIFVPAWVAAKLVQRYWIASPNA